MSADLARLSQSLMRDASGLWSVADYSPPELSVSDDSHALNFELEDSSFWFEHRNACIIAALKRHPFEGPLLDVGGGNGAVSAALESAGISTVLLEPAVAGARNALRRGLRNVICATLEQAAFEPDAFGAAGLFDVLEHVHDDHELLAQLRSALRRAGVLCITVPALPMLWSAEDELAGHYRRYTLDSLRQVVERAGFDVSYATYCFAPLVAPMFLLRSIPHRLYRRAREDVSAAATRQHRPPALAQRALRVLLGAEAQRIARGRRLPIGTSCLVTAVAR